MDTQKQTIIIGCVAATLILAALMLTPTSSSNEVHYSSDNVITGQGLFDFFRGGRGLTIQKADTPVIVIKQSNGNECQSNEGCTSGICSDAIGFGIAKRCGKALTQSCTNDNECNTNFCAQNTCSKRIFSPCWLGAGKPSYVTEFNQCQQGARCADPGICAFDTAVCPVQSRDGDDTDGDRILCDQCPGTEAGNLVDSNGCAIPITEAEAVETTFELGDFLAEEECDDECGWVRREEVTNLIDSNFNPTNVFDMFNARCKWNSTDALSVGGIIPNNFCSNQGSQQICVDALGVDYVTQNGAVEAVNAVNCNDLDFHQSLFVRCCDGSPTN